MSMGHKARPIGRYPLTAVTAGVNTQQLFGDKELCKHNEDAAMGMYTATWLLLA